MVLYSFDGRLFLRMVLVRVCCLWEEERKVLDGEG